MKLTAIVPATLSLLFVFVGGIRAQQDARVVATPEVRSDGSPDVSPVVRLAGGGRVVRFQRERQSLALGFGFAAYTVADERAGENSDGTADASFPVALGRLFIGEERALIQDPVPPVARQAEANVERNVRRYHVGFRGGATLDPELLSVGAHANVGPFFNRHVSFRPGVELGFGEVTTLFGVNLDGIYHVPNTTQGRWSPYVGAGPNLSVRHLSFQGEQDGTRFDFGNFDWQAGFNFLAGFESRSGTFVELNATAHSSPHVRLLIGFNF